MLAYDINRVVRGVVVHEKDVHLGGSKWKTTCSRSISLPMFPRPLNVGIIRTTRIV